MSSSRRVSSTQPAKKRVASSTSGAVAKKVATKKAATKSAATKQVATKSVVAKTPPKKAAVQKTVVKKVSPKKAGSSKPAAQKSVTQKSPSKSVTKTVGKSANRASNKAVTKAPVKKAASPTSSRSASNTSKTSKKVATSSVAKKVIAPVSSRSSGKIAKNSHPAEEKKVILKKSQDAISKSTDPVKKDEVSPTTPQRPAGVARAIFREAPHKPAVKRPVAPIAHQARLSESAPDLVATDDPGFLDSSEVFDETDHAQHQQLREQAAIQERARQMARPETHPDFDGQHCVDCDDEIPEFRLKIGRVRCVDCQQAIEDEHRRKQGMTSPSGPRMPEDWQM